MKPITVSLFNVPFHAIHILASATRETETVQIGSFLALVAALAIAAPLSPVPEPDIVVRQAEVLPVVGGGQSGGQLEADAEVAPGGGQWRGKRDALPERDVSIGKREAEAQQDNIDGSWCWYC